MIRTLILIIYTYIIFAIAVRIGELSREYEIYDEINSYNIIVLFHEVFVCIPRSSTTE